MQGLTDASETSSAALPRVATTIRDVLESSGAAAKIITLDDRKTYQEFKILLEAIEEIWSLGENTPPGCLFSLAFDDAHLSVTIRDLPGVIPKSGIKQCLEAVALNVDPSYEALLRAQIEACDPDAPKK